MRSNWGFEEEYKKFRKGKIKANEVENEGIT